MWESGSDLNANQKMGKLPFLRVNPAEHPFTREQPPLQNRSCVNRIFLEGIGETDARSMD